MLQKLGMFAMACIVAISALPLGAGKAEAAPAITNYSLAPADEGFNDIDDFWQNGDGGSHYVGFGNFGQTIAALSFDLSTVTGIVTDATLLLDVNGVLENAGDLFIDLKVATDDGWFAQDRLPNQPWTTIYREQSDLPPQGTPRTNFVFDHSIAIAPHVVNEMNGDDKITFVLEGNTSLTIPSGVTELEFLVDSARLIINTRSNEAPAAAAGNLTVTEDTQQTGALPAGTDPDGDALTYDISSQGTKGTVSITDASTGAFTYTPDPNQVGSDSFQYRAYDGYNYSAPATVSVTINNVNDAPVAQTSGLSVTEDVPQTGNLTASDIDGNPLTYSMVSPPSKGTVEITNATTGAYAYTPNLNATGSDSFTFRVYDGAEYSGSATINVTINGTNDKPAASGGMLGVTEDTPENGTLAGSDIDGDALTYSVATQAGKGNVVVTNPATGTFTYTPDANETGNDTFTFRVHDGMVHSDPATVAVTIASVNDAPVANDSSLSVTEDEAANGTVAATDAEGDPLIYSQVTGSTNGTLTFNPNGTYTYTPNANLTGTDWFTFKASDGTQESNTATVTLSIDGANDKPVANNGTLTLAEDYTQTGTLGGSDIDGDPLTYSVASQGGKGTVTITNASTGAYTYAPSANVFGTDTFTFIANDGTSDSEAATVTVTITPVNDAPVANEATLNVTEDETAVGQLTGSDLENDSLTYMLVSGPEKGNLLLNADGSFTYTPEMNITGSFPFTFRSNDGTASSATATATLVVGGVNDKPVANAGTLDVTEDTPVNGTLTGSDIDGDSLTYNVVAEPAKGTVAFTDAATGAYTYTPNANAFGSDTFTFKVNDGTVDSDAATITVTIAQVNDAPVASDASLAVKEDEAANGTVTGADVENDPLSYILILGPAKGMLTLNPNGTFTYTPHVDATGTDTFTFKASDGTLESPPATISVTIGGANDAPTANEGTLDVTEDTPANGTLTGSDIDGDSVTYSVVAEPEKGKVAITDAATGSYTYTPNANAAGSDTFTFKVNDGTAESAAATITVTIAAVNDAPAMEEIAEFRVNQDRAQSGAFTATDVEGDAIVYTIVEQGTLGVATVTGGAFTYTPNPGQYGDDRFKVQADDGNGGLVEVYVNVKIARYVPSPPPQEQEHIFLNDDKNGQYGTLITQTSNGYKTIIVQLNNELLLQALQRNSDIELLIKLTESFDESKVRLNGKLLDALADRESIVTIETPWGIYKLPASYIQLNKLHGTFGQGVNMDDVQIDIRIAKSSEKQQLLAQEGANGAGVELVIPPVEFEIVATYGGKEVVLDQFDGYVERWLPLPEGVNPRRVTSGVVLGEDGKLHHVPTRFEQVDGKYYAVIKSMTNSAYALIYNTETFTDIKTHWSRAYVEDMASRLIVQGAGDAKFNPDKAITRAEFASIITKAFGLHLPAIGDISAFSDIRENDWHAQTVTIAASFGLVQGYEDGTFRPNQTITRTEAMAILVRAMTYTILAGNAEDVEAERVLASFADTNEIPGWGRGITAAAVEAGIVQGSGGLLRPNALVTRAETAAMTARLLRLAELIDESNQQ